MIRGVIFDLDGVLVTTDELHYRSWKGLADEEGIYFDQTINHRLRGVSRMESLEIILERSDHRYDEREKQQLATRKNATYRRLLDQLTPDDILPGARACIESLSRRGIKLAVASSSKNAKSILEYLELVDAFDAVVDGNDISNSKPHPEVFELAAARIGLDPSECLVVEDAPAGVEAARRAGMSVFGIGSTETLPGVKPLASGLNQVSVDQLLATQA